jgi:hypothetical protein
VEQEETGGRSFQAAGKKKNEAIDEEEARVTTARAAFTNKHGRRRTVVSLSSINPSNPSVYGRSAHYGHVLP